mgnify:CR=1 FL=1
MEKLKPIKIPLLNPNEPQALLVSLLKGDREPVEKGQVIAEIETTKSTGEIVAESSGYLVGLRHSAGQTVNAGEVLAYIGDTPTAQDLTLPPWSHEHTYELDDETLPSGLRITAPARELALEKGISLSSLPKGPLVTRQMIQDRIETHKPFQPIQIPEGENRVVIYGAGGHGSTLAALVQKAGTFELIGFLDDGFQSGDQIMGLTVLGGVEKLPELSRKGIRQAINGVGGIGDLQIRLAVYDRLREAGFHTPTVVHPTAFVEDSAELADAIQVFAFAYVGIDVRVGYGTIINTGVIVSHNCTLGPYVNLSPGATLAGGVNVGEKTLIGMQVTVNLYVNIGKGVRIGNGATIKADVPDGIIVPAGSIWPPRQ